MPLPSDRTDELRRLRILEEKVRRLQLRGGESFADPVVWGVWGPEYIGAGSDFMLVPAGGGLPPFGGVDYMIPVDGPAGQEQRPGIWVWPLLGNSGGWGTSYFDSDTERHSVVTVPEDGYYVFGCSINDMIPRDLDENQVGNDVVAWFDPYVYTVKRSDEFGGIIGQFNGARVYNDQVVVGALNVNRGGMKAGAVGFCSLSKGDGIGSFFRPQPAPDASLADIDHVTWGGVGSAIPLLWAVKIPGPSDVGAVSPW